MVARINSSKNISKALNYNEQKVQQNVAQILYAHRFLKDASQLNFYEKLGHFQRLISLNERAAVNALHVSLNFHPSESLNDEKLTCIAQAYMERLGFGEQPYLVYRHEDAGHPHIHIVSTNIKDDGSRISLHNLGRTLSEKARKEIEGEFGLIKAGKEDNKEGQKIIPVSAQKVAYGKGATKQAIANILAVVLHQYQYTSLPELNAVLGLYNVVAERGEKDSRMYKGGGLTYRALDERGKKTGTPIKASAFHFRPTLPFLEQKFIQNEKLRTVHAKRLHSKITWALVKAAAMDLTAFQKALQKEAIAVVVRSSNDGFIYGLTYVDHTTKAVFNGSDLGKEYSARAILEKCNMQAGAEPLSLSREEKIYIQEGSPVMPGSVKAAKPVSMTDAIARDQILANGESLSDVLLKAEKDAVITPFESIKKRKRKKKSPNL